MFTLTCKYFKNIDRKRKTTPLVIEKKNLLFESRGEQFQLAVSRIRERSGIGFERNPENFCLEEFPKRRSVAMKHAKIDVQWQWVFLELMFANLVNKTSGVSCRVNIFVSIYCVCSTRGFLFREYYLNVCSKPAFWFLASAQFHVKL